tara:strand:- start:1636 stop:2154 length:519 start_codon:yes stop_codon:yes gene_type:complete
VFSDELRARIGNYQDFPRKNILFRDITPVLRDPELFSELIKKMSDRPLIKDSECIVAVDARGFIFASSISYHLSKPFILARKPGKLPGKLIESSYELEYGKNSLVLQLESLKSFKSFSIVDDLLATGGTVNAVSNLLSQQNKKITGLSVVVELSALNARSKFNFDVASEVVY